jgi:hypothetical protein
MVPESYASEAEALLEDDEGLQDEDSGQSDDYPISE